MKCPETSGSASGRPARRFRDDARVVRLAGDRRRDARRRLVGAVGAGPVADVEVQAAVRGHQRQPAADGGVAQRRRRETDRERAGKRRRREHGGASPRPHDSRDQPQADCRRDDQRVRPVQGEQRGEQAGAGPGRPSIAVEGAPVDERQCGDQHRIERRLQQHDLVERDHAGAGQQGAGGQAGGVAEPLARGAHGAARSPRRRAPPAPHAPRGASRRRARARAPARRRRAARRGTRRPRTRPTAPSRRRRRARPAPRTIRCRGRRSAAAADDRPTGRSRRLSRPPPRRGSPPPPPPSPIPCASRRILVDTALGR